MSFFGSTGIATLQGLIMLALGLLAFGLEIFALIDATRRRAGAFVAAGKQTKQRWLIFLGVAAAIGFVSLGNALGGPVNIFNLIAVVAAAVYITDVRPAVRGMTGGRGSGPYGPW